MKKIMCTLHKDDLVVPKKRKLQIFDEVICMKDGEIIESGNYEE